VLSGHDHDGTDGVQTVRAAGGVVIAQRPESSAVPAMPLSAIATGAVRAVLEPDEIGEYVTRLVREWCQGARAG
jgi:two-component system CheB/CheR fusion protein